MIRIRLSRVGKRNDPKYRIVAIEKHRKRGGKSLDFLGSWYPKRDELSVNKKLLNKWIDRGAQPSAKVRSLLKLK